MRPSRAAALLRGAAALLVASPLLVMGACNQVYDFEDPDAAAPVGCNATGCPLASLHCDQESGRCEACVEDANCSGRMHRCDVALHQCFECLALTDCPGGSTCVENQCVHTCPAPGCDKDETCNTTLGLCMHCESDAKCQMQPMPSREHICDVATGRCVECYRDSHCNATPDRPRCDLAIERCVQCVRAADCPAARPICDPARGQCVSA
jgi:hypothetical protein